MCVHTFTELERPNEVKKIVYVQRISCKIDMYLSQVFSHGTVWNWVNLYGIHDLLQ